jgi:hypothetical protein
MAGKERLLMWARNRMPLFKLAGAPFNRRALRLRLATELAAQAGRFFAE